MGMHLEEFMALNAEVGNHWFSNGTTRFFKSRVSNWDYISGLFISSERGPLGRNYTIRKANFETGRVETIGEFGQYSDIRSAKTKLRNLLRGKDV